MLECAPGFINFDRAELIHGLKEQFEDATHAMCAKMCIDEEQNCVFYRHKEILSDTGHESKCSLYINNVTNDQSYPMDRTVQEEWDVTCKRVRPGITLKY